MSKIMLKCKNCGANMQTDFEAKVIKCLHCGSTYLLSEILDKQDLDFLKKNSADDISKKLSFNDAIKQGETAIFKADFENAERFFKLAISIDEENYKGYFGVVKAKTKNFNSLPPNDDYKNYANKALELATPDDYVFIKNELEKLTILKKEHDKIQREKQQLQNQQKSMEQNRRIKANFFSKLAYFLTGIITIVLLVGIIVSQEIKHRENQNQIATIEVTSAEQFLKIFKDDKNLNSIIILKNDIDFNNISIAPLGLTAFSGELRGNGFAFKNLNISLEKTSEEMFVGLFAKTDGAKISGLVFDNIIVNFNGTESPNEPPRAISIGMLVGYAKNTQISNCSVESNCSVKSSNSYASVFVGGLCGQIENSKIEICYSQANLSVNEKLNKRQNHFVGAITGFLNNSSVLNCYSSSDISVKINSFLKTDLFVGCVSGQSVLTNENNMITNCFFSGKIVSEDDIKTFKTEHFAGVTNENPLKPIDKNKIYSNCIFFDENTFKSCSGDAVLKENLTDYIQSNHLILTQNLTEALNFIKTNFSSNWWTETDTIAPKLKISQKQNTGENVSVFLIQFF